MQIFNTYPANTNWSNYLPKLPSKGVDLLIVSFMFINSFLIYYMRTYNTKIDLRIEMPGLQSGGQDNR